MHKESYFNLNINMNTFFPEELYENFMEKTMEIFRNKNLCKTHILYLHKVLLSVI